MATRWIRVEGAYCSTCDVPLYRLAGVPGRNPVRCPGCDPRRIVPDLAAPDEVLAVLDRPPGEWNGFKTLGEHDVDQARTIAAAWRDAYVALVADTWQVPIPWGNRRLPWEPTRPAHSAQVPRSHPNPLPTQPNGEIEAHTATQPVQ